MIQFIDASKSVKVKYTISSCSILRQVVVHTVPATSRRKLGSANIKCTIGDFVALLPQQECPTAASEDRACWDEDPLGNDLPQYIPA